MIAPARSDVRSRGRLPLLRAMAAGLAIAAAVAAHAGDAGSCAPEAVHADTEGQSLTRAERLARMDRAFYDSLDRFDECQSAATGTDAATGAGGAATAAGRYGSAAGADGGTGGDSAGTGDGASVESVAAEGIQGAESPEAPETTVDGTSADDTSIESVAAGGIRGTEAPEDGEKTAADTDRPPAAGSGRTPDDIPAPDNDSVLEAQIRRAAMEESDPRIRAELWNEYRKYKGLPPKPLPGEEGENDDAQTSG